jgi:hypothetical protein
MHDRVRDCWRLGFAPLLSDAALRVLLAALDLDDRRLLQGQTTQPPPLECVADWPCEGACLIAYAGWQGEDLKTVAEVEEFFVCLCIAADQRLGRMAACAALLNWFDNSPRDVVRRELSEEIAAELERRRTNGT